MSGTTIKSCRSTRPRCTYPWNQSARHVVTSSNETVDSESQESGVLSQRFDQADQP